MTTHIAEPGKGHNCRVSLSATYFSVHEDDHDGPDKAELLQAVQLPVKAGEWHTLVVEIVGSEIVATLDGKHVAMGSNDAIAVSKTNVGLTVAGESASFRNFKVFEATAKKDWPATKAKLKEKAAK